MEDLFAGGAKGQASVLFFQQNDGSFKPSVAPAFIKDLYSEDVDAAAFDADGDSDPDLYIVTGWKRSISWKSVAGGQAAYKRRKRRI